MKREQTAISPEERRFHRVSQRDLLIFCVLGYVLYFTARWGEPPTWALAGIETLKPVLGALGNAARVSDVPFPAQVILIYCAFGFPFLTVWAMYRVFVTEDPRKIIMPGKNELPRWKLACLGVGQLVLILSFIGICIHEHTGSIGWEMHAFFSPGFGTATILLIGYGGFAMTIPIVFYWLWIALAGYPGKHVASSPVDDPIDQESDAPTIILKEGNHGQ
ncbi:hypothetical protein [Nitrosovibrio sp. Nv17]|uniref:hypothetical protein n=1 Tax=Nitrosovibrio sp. Nv17 TaxID=1855339 RepID=UPI0009086183|nr:hypothetical protein [Nitrosovibrio sp. Nv17]SFW29582.1 hypothetical protein SAMN05216414_1131 [Nitrosovibrio sp. Nv17]